MKLSHRKILGAILLLVPMSLLVAIMVDMGGWKEALLSLGVSIALTVCLAAGIRFLLDDP